MARSRRPVDVERAAARRRELLDAAVRVIRAEGPDTSMDHVAAEVGVTRPILYRHFGDRDGLAQAVAADFAAGLRADLRAALRRPAPPRAVLVAAIDAYLAFVEREPMVYRFLVRGSRGRRSGDVAEFLQEVSRDIAVVLGEQLRAAGRDSGAAEPWAFGLVGMVHLAGDWWIDRRSMPRTRLVEYLTTLLWDGMAQVGLEDATGPPALHALPPPFEPTTRRTS